MLKNTVIFGMIIGLLAISGCKVTDKEQENFEREYKRHKEQQEEPYIPVPEI